MSERNWERARRKKPEDCAFPKETEVNGPHTNLRRLPVKEFTEDERREWIESNRGKYGLRPNEVARTLGVSRTTVYKLVKEGRLHITKIGTCSVFSSDEVGALIKETRR